MGSLENGLHAYIHVHFDLWVIVGKGNLFSCIINKIKIGVFFGVLSC
jgi:hypothetical protein